MKKQIISLILAMVLLNAYETSASSCVQKPAQPITRVQALVTMNHLIKNVQEARENPDPLLNMTLLPLSLAGTVIAQIMPHTENELLSNTIKGTGFALISLVAFCYMVRIPKDNTTAQKEAWNFIQFLVNKTIDDESGFLIPQTRIVKRYAFTKRKLKRFALNSGKTIEEFNAAIRNPRDAMTRAAHRHTDNKLFQPI